MGMGGRHLMANTKIEGDNQIKLSDGEDLSESNFNLLIFDDEPPKVIKQSLERGFGLLV
jgi:hypothetical protein